MNYLDSRMKILLRKQNEVNRAAYKASEKRQKAHNDIKKTIARAILKGSFLSQEVWTLPSNWVDHSQRGNFALSLHASTGKSVVRRWGNVIEYMKEYCYQVPLAPGISLTYRDDDMELSADNNERMTAFIKKYGIPVICPDVDTVIDTLNDKLEFVKNIRGQLKAT